MKILFIFMGLALINSVSSASAEITVGTKVLTGSDQEKVQQVMRCLRVLDYLDLRAEKSLRKALNPQSTNCPQALRKLSKDRVQVARQVLNNDDFAAVVEEIHLLASELGHKVGEASVRKMAKDLIRTRGTEPTEARIQQAMINDMGGMK